jgi:DNA invertase Pin-like site-specific DNA recombinase
MALRGGFSMQARRVGIYVRVSTDDQTTARARHTVVRVFEAQGVSGAEGPRQAPGLRCVAEAAVRREVDIIAVSA